MKIMTAKEAKNSFGIFVDTAQIEPVLVTRRQRPIGVFLSIQEITNIPELKKMLLKYMDKKMENPLLTMLLFVHIATFYKVIVNIFYNRYNSSDDSISLI